MLFGYIKRLSKRRKYLRTIFSGHVFPKNNQHLTQKLFGETKNNISIFGFCFTKSKANNQLFYKTEIRIFSERRYKVCQIK